MSGWFLRLIGVNEQVASHVDRVHWLWSRPDWLILGLILLIPAGWFIVRRHRRNLPHVNRTPRRLLSACRIGVLLLLVLVLGGPYVRLDETIHRKPVLGWIVDESASMKLPAGPFDAGQLAPLARAAGLVTVDENSKDSTTITPDVRKQLNTMTRAQLLDRVMAHDAKMMKSLEDRFEVKFYRVARRVRAVDDESDPGKISDSDASETSLGEALTRAIDDAAGRQLAGVVLMSDGQNTFGTQPLAALRRAGVGETDKGPKAPIWTVPVGSENPAADLALADVMAPAQVTKGDTVSILAMVNSHGYDGREVTVKLMSGDKVLDSAKTIVHDNQREQTPLTYTAKDTGEQLLRVEVEPADGEAVKDNNSRMVRVAVGTQTEKVLVIEGFPRWDFRFLDHALRRDRGLSVTFVMESQLLADGVKPADLPKAAGLPSDAKGFAEYHVVVLGDISPAMLPPALQSELVKAVEDKGVGLIVQAGTQNMPMAFDHQPLAKVLPVVMDNTAKPAGATDETAAFMGAARGGVEAPAFAPFSMTVTPAGSLYPAFSVYPNATRNRQLWSHMPKFYWAAAAKKVKPGATLLAEFESPTGKRPLIAEQFVGRGRVMFVGTDGTFRWRRYIGDTLFYRFWGQSIRHVRRMQEHGEDESWIEANPHEIEVGGEAAVELYALNGSGQPREDAKVAVKVVDQQENTKSLELETTKQPGHYRGMWRGEQAGVYTFTYTDPRGKAATAHVAVTDSGRERLHPVVDRDTLGALADVSGGGLLELGDLQDLPKRLQGEAVTIHRPREAQIWDNWLMLVLLVVFYCTDVGIRRLLGLT